jgi:hypothetical protein
VLRCQRVLDSHRLAQNLDGWADALQWHPGPTERRQNERLGEADERHGRLLTPTWPDRDQRIG